MAFSFPACLFSSACPLLSWCSLMELKVVPLEIPEGGNLILGQSHFIKTVEDIYEAIINTVPQMKFGIAFNEASGPCLVRVDGNDPELQSLAARNAAALAAGHIFVVVMREGYPINVLGRIKDVPEVCTIFCATANPVEVIIAETAQGRGILGVIDGFPPKGIETDDDATKRRAFLRMIGYKR
jgi:adenosine/AMP kinase